MKKIVSLILIVFLWSCENKPSLQKYFVKNAASEAFITIDVAASLFNVDEPSFTPEEKEVLASFEKMNILTYKTDFKAVANYDKEIKEVKSLLKEETTYQQLLKMGSSSEGASVYFVGDPAHINEFVVLAHKKENGFAVIRILGNDMNPANIATLLNLMKKSAINLEQLKPLERLVN